MKTMKLLRLLFIPFFVLTVEGLTAQQSENYWIYEDFSQFDIDLDYIIEETTYNTAPNNVILKTIYANFEATEGDCQNESFSHLRIRGLQDDGFAEFTVSDAGTVTIKVKGKSTLADRAVDIYRNGALVKSFADLDRNNCATFTEEINSTDPVTYKISGGDVESTKPIVITSIIVTKYNAEILTYNVDVSTIPENVGSIKGSGTYNPNDRVELEAIPYLGYEFEKWTSNGEFLSSENPLAFDIVRDTSIIANFTTESNTSGIYWIYEDFSQHQSALDYIIEETSYNTVPNNIALKTAYANFEATEGNCQNESSSHLRIRGLADNGWAEFTVPNAKTVTLKIKGKSDSKDRIIYIYRGGNLIKTITNLDRDNCEIFSEEINSETPVTYKITGGDAISTKPVVITSIIVTKHETEVPSYNVAVSTNPQNSGRITGAGTYYRNETVKLKASPVLGYKFEKWTSKGETISKSNPFSFNITNDTTIVANFSEVDVSKYWIYEDFSLFETATDYYTEEKSYQTNPNNINITTEYANFEAVEGDCQNESLLHLRIRGAMDNGWAEFTVPDASNVTINVKGKSTDSDRIVKIFRNDIQVKSFANLDRNNCATFTEKIDSETPVKYKITGGDSESTKPIAITSIYVQKFGEGTGINSSKSDVMSIYPNPVKDILNIELTENSNNAKIFVYNITGVCVFDKNLNNEKYLDLSKLPSGMYILYLTGDNYTASQKFVKQ